MSIIFKLFHKNKGKFCKLNDNFSYEDVVDLAKKKFALEESEEITLTDEEDTIVENDCIAEVLQTTKILKVVTPLKNQSDYESSNSTLSIIDDGSTPTASELDAWLLNTDEGPENSCGDGHQTTYQIVSIAGQETLNLASGSQTTLNLASGSQTEIQVDKDGFCIPLRSLSNSTSKHQDLKQFLQKNGGSHILSEYEEIGILSDRTRRDLVNLTVKMMLNEFGQNLTKIIKVEYAKAIVQLFPKLKDPTSSKGGYEIFYDDSQKTPSGYLAWRLRTVMRTRGNVKKRKCDDDMENRVPFKKPTNIEISAEEERDIEFLKNSNYRTQKEEIFEKMKRTINVRKQRNFTIDDFPRFLDTHGLIHQDFTLLYPNSCPFAPKFEKYIDIIFKVYDKTACSRSSLIDGSVPGWDKPTRALLALLYMLPATAKGKKVGRRDSFESSVDKLLIFCTVGEPLQRIVDERKGFQPYLIGVGANKAAISEYKVVIDSKIVDNSCNNIIESFDFLFKSYFIFKVRYDSGLDIFFRFIETFFYNITSDVINMTTKMKEVMNRLQTFIET